MIFNEQYEAETLAEVQRIIRRTKESMFEETSLELLIKEYFFS